jgi:hypothetical protein
MRVPSGDHVGLKLSRVSVSPTGFVPSMFIVQTSSGSEPHRKATRLPSGESEGLMPKTSEICVWLLPSGFIVQMFPPRSKAILVAEGVCADALRAAATRRTAATARAIRLRRVRATIVFGFDMTIFLIQPVKFQEIELLRSVHLGCACSHQTRSHFANARRGGERYQVVGCLFFGRVWGWP